MSVERKTFLLLLTTWSHGVFFIDIIAGFAAPNNYFLPVRYEIIV